MNRTKPRPPKSTDFEPLFPRHALSPWWMMFVALSGGVALGIVYLCLWLEGVL